jgi:hypothetical protein
MRRILTTAVASSLLALALPAAASAHHSAHRAAVRHHRRHHHRAHTVVFTAGSVRTMPGTTAPATPSAPTGSEPAATITSFENGVLKLTLADGSTVSGKVTEQTEIECAANQQPGDDNGGSDDQGDDQGEGQGDDSHGGPGPSSFSQVHGDDEHGGDNQGDNGEEGTCGASSLTPGAKVAEADLAVTGTGSFWEKIELA